MEASDGKSDRGGASRHRMRNYYYVLHLSQEELAVLQRYRDDLVAGGAVGGLVRDQDRRAGVRCRSQGFLGRRPEALLVPLVG